ncbi:MAG: hypothetical protein RL266_1939 [Bacteroidota bacterium]
MKKLLLLLILFATTSQLFAQQDSVQNGGFEFWGTNPFYDEPNNWTTLNPLAQIFGVELAFRTTDPAEVNSGASAIKLETKNIPGVGDTPSILTNGLVNTTTQSIEGGTPISSRPLTFNFSYRFDPLSTDSASVSIRLTRYNPSSGDIDLIGQAGLDLGNSQGNWIDESLSINYMGSGQEMPDTVLILFNTGTPPNVAVGTSLFVDDVYYGYSGLGISSASSMGIQFYPNPVNDALQFSTTAFIEPVSYQIISVDGRMMDAGRISDVSETINVSGLNSGFYNLVLNTEQGLVNHRFVKQ